jgi:hypothetical protein
MKFNNSVLSLLVTFAGLHSSLAFTPAFSVAKPNCRTNQQSALEAIGLGPGAEEKAQELAAVDDDKDEIEEPDHELFRDTRLGKFDKQCDDWYGNILKQDQPSCLGKVSEEALRRINTLPKLEKKVRREQTFL